MLYRVNHAWARFEPTTLVVIGTDCIGIYKSNYHMIMTTTAHKNTFKFLYIFIQLCQTTLNFYTPLVERGLYCNHLVRLSVHSHFRNRYLSFYWKKWFYIWYMALAWWLVLCLPFPGLPHIYFLFTVRLRIVHVCRKENFRNSYLSFYWKKWFYIWYMALAWWLVPCLPFPGLRHIYFLFTVRLTNKRMGVFLAWLRCNILLQHILN
jgi:hypothetical protein